VRNVAIDPHATGNQSKHTHSHAHLSCIANSVESGEARQADVGQKLFDRNKRCKRLRNVCQSRSVKNGLASPGPSVKRINHKIAFLQSFHIPPTQLHTPDSCRRYGRANLVPSRSTSGRGSNSISSSTVVEFSNQNA
jgi:hypothetical protein